MIGNSKILQRFSLFFLQSQKFSTARGSLFTWGQYSSGTGFLIPSSDEKINQPKKVDIFQDQVSKVSMGPYHTAVITADGSLYTFGCGKYGALGHDNSCNSDYEPKIVDFFKSKNLKVVDAVCGEHHTIAVTEGGDIYSWGYGGSCSWLNWIYSCTGALGSGSQNHRFSPDTVGRFGTQKIKCLTTGDKFATVLTEGNEVYGWGCAKDGALGDGICDPILQPTLIQNFQVLKTKNNLTIQKVKSASHFSVGLFSDGNLYSWGRNNGGSLGIAKILGHVTDQVAYIPTPVVNESYKGQKIVDFDVGENSLVILTDKNQVFFSGFDLAYKPVKWEVPTDKKIKQVVASKDSIAALTEDNKLYLFNEFVEPARQELGGEYFTANSDIFNGGNIVEIGGNYSIKYAIIKA